MVTRVRSTGRVSAASLAIAIALTAGAARAQAPEGPAEEVYNHEGQFGLRLGFGIPFVFAIKYADGPACSDNPGDTICYRFGSPILDLDVTFGVTKGLELSALVRLGVTEDEAAQSMPLLFGFGVRAMPNADPVVKPFLGAKVILDATSSDVPEWNSVDVGARGEVGIQIDPLRNLGFFVQLGVNLTILRALQFSPDVTAGVQGRFP